MCVWNSLYDGSYYTAFSLRPHSSVIYFKQRGKIINSKTALPFGTRLWFKKDLLSAKNKKMFKFACFGKDHIWLNMLQREFISKVRKMVTFLFSPFLWPLWSAFALQLHVVFYTSGHQPARLVCVCIKM